jgi:hypothetical protein
MIGKLSFWVGLVMIGVVLTLGMQLRNASGKNAKLLKERAVMSAQIGDLKNDLAEAKAVTVLQGELEQDSNVIRDRVTKEIVIVNQQPKTSDCGPAVHSALDELRKH